MDKLESRFNSRAALDVDLHQAFHIHPFRKAKLQQCFHLLILPPFTTCDMSNYFTLDLPHDICLLLLYSQILEIIVQSIEIVAFDDFMDSVENGSLFLQLLSSYTHVLVFGLEFGVGERILRKVVA